jgi:hypothetical protein
MNIETGNGTYEVSRYEHGWILRVPKSNIDNKTKKMVHGWAETYHMTIGQCLAIIAEIEMGKAKDVESLMETIETLRNDLLNIK